MAISTASQEHFLLNYLLPCLENLQFSPKGKIKIKFVFRINVVIPINLKITRTIEHGKYLRRMLHSSCIMCTNTHTHLHPKCQKRYINLQVHGKKRMKKCMYFQMYFEARKKNLKRFKESHLSTWNIKNRSSSLLNYLLVCTFDILDKFSAAFRLLWNQALV